MISEEKIKVFISSRCGGERINYEKFVNSSSISKKEVAEIAIKTNYDLVRRALKLYLEETGLIKAYTFEDDLASSSSAEEDFINKIDESHVCLFLLDNFDEKISGGILKEISRAQNSNKKSIYLFINDPGHEKTSIQKILTGARGAHYREITDIRDFIDIGFRSVINDIIKIYQQYSKEDYDLAKKVTSSIEITSKTFPIETIDINKQIFEELGLTKKKILGLIFNPEEEETRSSDFDKLCLVVLEVLLGEKKFYDVNLQTLIETLGGIQSPELHAIVNKRWEAISSFYNGDVDNAISILESIYNKNSQNGNIQKWLLNDILIDLSNISIIKNQAENEFDFSTQEKINQQISLVFFPLIDRFNANINDDILDRNFKDLTNSPYSNTFYNIKGLFGSISNYLFTAIYYGSFVHLVFTLKQIQKVLFDLVQKENNLLHKIQLMRVSILLGNENDFSRIMDKNKSSLSNSTTKEILDLYKLADTKPLAYQKASWKLILFKEIGYYFSDFDYEIISSELIDNSHYLLSEEDLNIRLVEKFIEALKFNKERISQEKIVNFVLEVFSKIYFRFFDSIFDLLSSLNFSSMPQELIADLLLQVKPLLENEEFKQRVFKIEKFFIKIRKDRSDFNTVVDEMVEQYYPEFFNNDFHLEIYPNDRIIHIKRYIESIKSRNNVQGKNGLYIYFADNPFIIIKNIIEHDRISLPEEILDNLLKEITNTLFSETQTFSEKNNSIQLLLFIKSQDFYQNYNWSSYYSNIKQNITKVEKGASEFFTQDSGLLLKLSLIILQITFSEDCLQDILEILASLNNADIREIIESLVALEDFLKIKKHNPASDSIISVVIQYVSAFCFNNNGDIRYYTVRVLYQLIDSQYSGFIVNRLVKMMDDNDFKVKWAIVHQASLIKTHSVTAFNYIVGKAKIDNNYLVRKALDAVSEK